MHTYASAQISLCACIFLRTLFILCSHFLSDNLPCFSFCHPLLCSFDPLLTQSSPHTLPLIFYLLSHSSLPLSLHPSLSRSSPVLHIHNTSIFLFLSLSLSLSSSLFTSQVYSFHFSLHLTFHILILLSLVLLLFFFSSSWPSHLLRKGTLGSLEWGSTWAGTPLVWCFREYSLLLLNTAENADCKMDQNFLDACGKQLSSDPIADPIE